MRFLILLPFLLLAGLPAQAQATAPPPIEAPACFPFINGVHAFTPRLVEGELGRHIYWACSPRGGSAKIYGWSCPHGQCLAGAAKGALQLITGASAKVGAAQEQYRVAMAYDCPVVIDEQTPRGALCRERQRLMLANILEWVKDGEAGQ